MSKPLSKAEREAIEKLAAIERDTTVIRLDALQAALDSEAFWRSAVLDADVCGVIGAPCPWCGAVSYSESVAVHKPDCPWRLAQGLET